MIPTNHRLLKTLVYLTFVLALIQPFSAFQCLQQHQILHSSRLARSTSPLPQLAYNHGTITPLLQYSHSNAINQSSSVKNENNEWRNDYATVTKRIKESKTGRLVLSLLPILMVLFTVVNSARAHSHAPVATVLSQEKGAMAEVHRSLARLVSSVQGVKLDSLIMLLTSSAVVPIFKRLNLSPIIGFLLSGTLLGPYGLNWVKDLHLIDVLGELGIVIFLFEMGLELSIDRLKSMRKDVFGLGTSQFLLTSAAGAFAAKLFGLSTPAAVTIGGSLALSSSAFVLQLLKDKNAMESRHGKASFGILLLQDLAVVPLLVVVELLAAGGGGIGKALSIAGAKALVTVATLIILGKTLLNPIFSAVAKSRSQEAFLSIIFSTVFAMSFVTHGIGLSDTLGAFLAGILLSETHHKHKIEADIAPFRGLLLGFFFIKVGFSIDMMLILKEIKTIALMLTALIAGKASIITLLSMVFGVPLASAQQCGLLNSQGGEFAFVALGLAETAGLISSKLSKLLLTTVALSMAITPALSELGAAISNKMGVSQDFGAASVEVEEAVVSH